MRRLRRRPLLWLLAVLVVLPLGARYALGMDVLQTLLLDAIAAGVVGLVVLRPTVSEQTWWPETVTIDRDQGARRDLSRMSWAVSDQAGRAVGRVVVLRLRRIAARRLERLGLDLDDPADRDAVTNRLGTETVRVLDPHDIAEVNLKAFTHAVAAVEALGAQLDQTERSDRSEPSDPDPAQPRRARS